MLLKMTSTFRCTVNLLLVTAIWITEKCGAEFELQGDKPVNIWKRLTQAEDVLKSDQQTFAFSPYCYACAGQECEEPRVKHRDGALPCNKGDVCWTIQTIKCEPQVRIMYYRGCGRQSEYICSGNRTERQPLRNTAGQNAVANGAVYCAQGVGISQCKACCVNDYCNGAQLQIYEHKSSRNGAQIVSLTLGWEKVVGAQAVTMLKRFSFVVFVWWVTLVVAFPPQIL
ncbi:uncharacterized protein LOC143445996 [Clavelina lepadiformis]|uniref:uncharacterized protein LOC143445996 n=1 Tax=Clavelina lepadiformis TaxID=159417 RepID=UPI0040412E49